MHAGIVMRTTGWVVAVELRCVTDDLRSNSRGTPGLHTRCACTPSHQFWAHVSTLFLLHHPTFRSPLCRLSMLRAVMAGSWTRSWPSLPVAVDLCVLVHLFGASRDSTHRLFDTRSASTVSVPCHGCCENDHGTRTRRSTG